MRDMDTPIGGAPPRHRRPTVSVTAPADGATVCGTVNVTASARTTTRCAACSSSSTASTSAPRTRPPRTRVAGTPARRPTAPTRSPRSPATPPATPATSAAVTVTVSNDTTRADGVAHRPGGGRDGAGSVSVTAADASDNVGVVGVQFKLDGANLGARGHDGPVLGDLEHGDGANGSHTLTAVARDAAGNTTRPPPSASPSPTT